MKRNKRRLPVPQHEFLFAGTGFQSRHRNRTGRRSLARERDEADRARRAAESAQARLFTSQNSK